MTDEPKLYDPTRIDITYDPREMRMKGTAIHGNTPFDVPYISHVCGNLWQGGCANDLQLPHEIEYVVSLYPWEKYQIADPDRVEVVEIHAYDSEDPGTLGGLTVDQLNNIADVVIECMKKGPTLVHCQAGLNRSGLLAAIVLVRSGECANGHQAIELLRSRRSPAVLCNQRFEQYVRSL